MRNGGLEAAGKKPAATGADGVTRPTQEQAEEAVRTLIAWAGDNPAREGLAKTPRRVVEAWREYFAGYDQNPADFLSRTFKEAGGYDDIVLVGNIPVNSHCEHHIAPFIGEAYVAYLPDARFVGLSKLARVVDLYSRRLQTQETMTAQIGRALEEYLKPKGVAVAVRAHHQCMTMRGISKRSIETTTLHLSGRFREDAVMERRFLRLAGAKDEG